jgi:hypothetical protein
LPQRRDETLEFRRLEITPDSQVRQAPIRQFQLAPVIAVELGDYGIERFTLE